MTALTAHLVDDVVPAESVLQWALSLPHRVRHLLAQDHDLSRTVVAVFLPAVIGFLRDRARTRGILGDCSGAWSFGFAQDHPGPLDPARGSPSDIEGSPVEGWRGCSGSARRRT